MRPLLRLTAVCITAILAVACGKKDTFTIKCETDPTIERMIVFTYADASGVKRQTVPLSKGKAVLNAKSPAYTLVTASLSDGTPIADCIMHNGDNATLRFSLDPDGTGRVTDLRVKANRPTDRLHRFEQDNDSLIAEGLSHDLNLAVREYVTANPDDPVSTVLLLRYYDARDREAGADSLVMKLSPSARPMALLQNYGAINAPQLDKAINERLYTFSLFTARDSVKTIRINASRQMLMAFLSTGPDRRIQLDGLRKLWELHDTLRLRIIDYSFAGDSAGWRSEIANDSVDWIQAWAPGGASGAPIRKLRIPRQPFYILIDSNGQQIYRGSDLSAAQKEAFDNLKKRRRDPAN